MISGLLLAPKAMEPADVDKQRLTVLRILRSQSLDVSTLATGQEEWMLRRPSDQPYTAWLDKLVNGKDAAGEELYSFAVLLPVGGSAHRGFSAGKVNSELMAAMLAAEKPLFAFDGYRLHELSRVECRDSADETAGWTAC